MFCQVTLFMLVTRKFLKLLYNPVERHFTVSILYITATADFDFVVEFLSYIVWHFISAFELQKTKSPLK